MKKRIHQSSLARKLLADLDWSQNTWNNTQPLTNTSLQVVRSTSTLQSIASYSRPPFSLTSPSCVQAKRSSQFNGHCGEGPKPALAVCPFMVFPPLGLSRGQSETRYVLQIYSVPLQAVFSKWNHHYGECKTSRVAHVRFSARHGVRENTGV